VVVVESFDDLDARPDEAITGRIVLFDVPYQGYGRTVPYRSRGAIAAARKGAVALLVRSIGPNGMRLPHTGTMVYDESVPRIPAAAVSSEDAMMMRRMQDRGDRIVARLKMQARTEPDRLSHHVVGELVGRELPEEVVVIGGHIDSWDVGQGAQDDGVGCMISLAAAELMLRSGLVPRRTIRVVFWTNEENGLRGGEAYRDRHADSLDRHVAAIESDSGNGAVMGFRFDLRAAALGPTDGANDAALESARTRGLELLRPIAGLLASTGADSVFVAGGGADIGPIAELGVPCLGLHHDTSEYFMIHHTAADTFDRIDPRTLQRNVAAMAVMAWALAEMPGSLRP
jgi:carboxypeptidase Q